MAEPLRPARGVELGQVLPVTGVLAAAGVALLVACVLYRRGRLPRLDRTLSRLERLTGRPRWAVVPTALAGTSLLTAGFGYYWDVAVHIGNGRDSSPFGTPAHWPILLGLLGITAAGILALALDDNADGGAALRLPFGLRGSLGGGLLLLCGGVGVLGFPLDDLWHNAFGQDVTLWSPTHIEMVAGASLATLAHWVLLEEGIRRTPAGGGPRGRMASLERLQPIAIAGAFLIGLSTLQAEFDFGVPQFNATYHPILIALAAGIGLTAARVRLGVGGALMATAFFLIVRGTWAVVIDGFGLTTPHVALYVVEALLVEAVAFAVPPTRHVRFGLVAGALIGTVGVAAEWGYSQVAFPLPWNAALFPRAALLAAVAGIAGGLLGALTGRALLPATARGESAPREPAPRLVPGFAFAAALAVIAVTLPIGNHPSYSATVDVEHAAPGTANLTVRLSPPSLAEEAAWFNVTSWQGGQRLIPGSTGFALTPLEKVSDGVYRTTRPVPIAGDWKTLLRVATAGSLDALPIYLPEDKAIPAAGVPATPQFTRSFVPDVKILQREQLGGSPTLKRIAYAVLGLLALLWIGSVAWALQRLDRSSLNRTQPIALAQTPKGSLV